jgi:hypothetical protein
MSKIESGRRIVSVERPVCHQYKQSIEESRGKDPKHDTKVVWRDGPLAGKAHWRSTVN